MSRLKPGACKYNVHVQSIPILTSMVCGQRRTGNESEVVPKAQNTKQDQEEMVEKLYSCDKSVDPCS